jgi:hypothetical protein
MTEQTAQTAREEQAQRLEKIAAEARLVADHALVAATHFRNAELARAGAHGFAAEGHLVNVKRMLDEVAVHWASRSVAQA